MKFKQMILITHVSSCWKTMLNNDLGISVSYNFHCIVKIFRIRLRLNFLNLVCTFFNIMNVPINHEIWNTLSEKTMGAAATNIINVTCFKCVMVWNVQKLHRWLINTSSLSMWPWKSFLQPIIHVNTKSFFLTSILKFRAFLCAKSERNTFSIEIDFTRIIY